MVNTAWQTHHAGDYAQFAVQLLITGCFSLMPTPSTLPAIHFAALSDPGQNRTHNEDSLLCSAPKLRLDMAMRARELAQNDAAQRVADVCLEVGYER